MLVEQAKNMKAEEKRRLLEKDKEQAKQQSPKEQAKQVQRRSIK